ncbi:MAG: hypothetical protein Kapaf2KO_11910 [Candidatus Kapaibacteriales bacterium]
MIFISTLSGKDLAEKYPNILSYKNNVDKDDSLVALELINEEFMEQTTDGGGELIGYYDSDSIVRKIEVTVYLSNGIQEYTYYLQNHKPLLIYDSFSQYRWDETMNSFDYTNFDLWFHGTYIFSDGELIDHISLGHNRFEDDEIDIEKTFKTECNYFLEKILNEIRD